MITATSPAELRRQIDALPMSLRLQKLRAKYFEEAPQVCAERLKLSVKSLRETEGEPIDLRSAKKLKAVLEGMPLVIFDGELTPGSQTRFFRGSAPYIDWNGTYFEHVVEGNKVTFGGPAEVGNMSAEDWEACKEAAAYFKGRTPAEAALEMAKAVYGDWYDDAMEIRASSPRYEEVPYLPGLPMWEKLVRVGLGGIIREAEEAMASFRASNEHDPDKLYFWQGTIIACQAVIDYAHRYARLAREMAARETDPARRQELEDLATACDWVPEKSARTFLEAVVSFRLTHSALIMENARKGNDLGRMDMFLYPYFKRDIEEGRITLEKAADILGDFITYVARLEQIRAAQHGREGHQATMINHITLGGVNRDGVEGANELTHLMLHVLGQLRYAEPHATVRLHEGTPDWLMEKCLETNQKVNGIPMYLNDKHVIDVMCKKGIPLEVARDWGVVGCSQPVVPDYGHYNPLQMNTAVPLDLALHNGVSPLSGKQIGPQTGDPRTFKSFDELVDAYHKQYEFVFGRLFRIQNLMHLASMQVFRMPLRSALDSATIRNGKSHLTGGAEAYPLWHNKDRALVDVGDSLTAVKKLVFEDRKLTMGELLDALDSDFAGERGEEIRRMCLAAPKYGNDIDEADYVLRDVAKFSGKFVTTQKNCFGYPHSVNRNGVSWHYSGGKGVGAFPNGRKARAPFADGSLSPMNGMDRNGPTAVLNSAIKADFTEAMVGILNQKFPLTVVQNPETMQKIAALTRTFIGNGGLHVQFNFIDKKVLLEAKKHPEKHKDLVVRVAGYSAYFVNLTPEVQDEIISRTEQSL
ncbi:MAG: hypothetical protein HYX92_21065 [Chloroflexi bacterium]|nr:hypothetical protein [Chloroflexota bacterium]